MIHTLFIINFNGEIVFERHYRTRVSQSVVDEFWKEVESVPEPTDVKPVLAGSKYYMVHIIRGGMFFLAVLLGEAPPLMTIELLERIASLFKDYFGGLNEELLKDNFVVAYELLEELCDSGFPVTTEPTVLKDLVAPPSLLIKLKDIVGQSTHMSITAASLENSPVPWRKRGVKYTNNEIFFDTVEELDCIIDANGALVSSECYGRIEANCKLSGMPDVLLTFVNPSVLNDISFHPSVRTSRYEQDRSLSFVPPDGLFELLKYRSDYTNQAPFYVTPKLSFHKDHGRVNIIVGYRGGGFNLPEKGITDVKIYIKLPSNTTAAKLEASQGTYHFDLLKKELRWDVGRIGKEKAPTINGQLECSSGTEFPITTPPVTVKFKIPGQTLSGLKIDTVGVVNERYKPFKGMRFSTHAGLFEVRTC